MLCAMITQRETNRFSEQKRFTAAHLLRIKYPTTRVPMHLSPDGRWLSLSLYNKELSGAAGALQAGNAAVPNEVMGSRVFLVNTDTGELQQPWPEAHTSWGGRWSPDGRRLAAYVEDAGAIYVAIWMMQNQAVTVLRSAPVQVNYGFEVLQWTPDSAAVIVKLRTIAPPTETLSAHDDVVSQQAQNGQAISVLSYDPTRDNVTYKSSRSDWAGDLGRIDVESGVAQRLTIGWEFCGWRVAPDGHAMAVLRHRASFPAEQRRFFDLVTVPLNGDGPQVVAENIQQDFGINFNWSPDSRQLAYVTSEHPRGSRGSVYVVEVNDEGSVRKLSGDEIVNLSNYGALRWSADSRFVYALAGNDIWQFSATREMGAANYHKTSAHFHEDGTTGWVFAWIQQPFSNTLWTLDDESLLAVIGGSPSKENELARINLKDGTTEVLQRFPYIYTRWNFTMEAFRGAAAASSSCYLLVEAADQPLELWRMSGSSSAAGATRRLCNFNSHLEGVILGKSRLVTWQIANKVCQGALLLPPDYAEGQRIPLIVNVYGGAWASKDIHTFGFDGGIMLINAQLLAAQGYAVLCPDMPMEDANPLRQMPGLVVPAVEQVIEMGIADPKRLGVMGQSYGGYTVLSLLTQTKLFRVGVCATGACNLTSYYSAMSDDGFGYGVGWSEKGQGRLGGSPWEKREAYIENSPFFSLDKVNAPLLLLAGEESKADCEQAKETFSALRRLGQRVELRLYAGEEHGLGRFATTQSDICSAVLDWLAAYLK